MQIERHKTAIIRRRLSKPMELLVSDLLEKDCTILDYGCGHGEDMRILKAQGFPVASWDPHYAPVPEPQAASVVNLGYVINIIENPTERKAVLQQAWKLAEDLLCVSVMVRNNSPQGIHEKPFGDGILTSWNTFQKYFSQSELRRYLQESLELPSEQIVMAGLGVAYLFKTNRYRKKFLESRIKEGRSGIAAELREQEFRRILSEWINLYHELGRMPSSKEFKEYNYIIRAFGSRKAALQAIRSELNEETVAEQARIRKEALQVEIARLLIHNQNRAKMADLFPEEQSDVKIFYGNFKQAEAAARENLKRLSQLNNIHSLIKKSEVGKILPDAIYIHRESLFRAPLMLQLLVELAESLFPDTLPWDIVKIHKDSHRLSFLEYPDFMEEPHPALHASMQIDLPKRNFRYKDYSASKNPPILHRKESFLHSTHPNYELFMQLTQAEEEAGLLSRPNIGHRRQWQELLETEGWEIEDHILALA